jgi:hypothetical protein
VATHIELRTATRTRHWPRCVPIRRSNTWPWIIAAIRTPIPNDSLFGGQWYLQTAQVSSVNAVGAWDRELGSTAW